MIIWLILSSNSFNTFIKDEKCKYEDIDVSKLENRKMFRYTG